AVSAANQQRTSRNDCSAEPCPQPRAGPSLFVTASSANSTSFSKQRPDPRNSPEGQSMQWEQGDFRVINARGVLHHPPGCRDRSERADSQLATQCARTRTHEPPQEGKYPQSEDCVEEPARAS